MNSTPAKTPEASVLHSPSQGDRTDHRERRTLIYFTASVAALLLASVIYAPWATTGPVFCPFRFMTGLPCPGCGLTRSFCAISQGQFKAAFAAHLFGPAVYLAAVLSLPIMIYQLITHRRVQWFHRLCYSKSLAKILALSLGTYHLIRIVMLIQSGQLFYAIAHAPVVHLFRFN